VYRARDTKLDRDVALKLLSQVTHAPRAHELIMPLQPGTTLAPYSVTAKIGDSAVGMIFTGRDQCDSSQRERTSSRVMYVFRIVSFGRSVCRAVHVGRCHAGDADASHRTNAEEAIRDAFLADLETMRGKFLGLAEAFPADKYAWRPMDGVRSVSEVLMLVANEGYGLVPDAFGGLQAVQTLSSGADKAQVIDELTRGFAYAKAQVEAVDPAMLTGTRAFFGQHRTTPQIVGLVAGDMHEHLGQLIAYARISEIVPPWSQ
jgi:hypothetical protein